MIDCRAAGASKDALARGVQRLVDDLHARGIPFHFLIVPGGGDPDATMVSPPPAATQ